MIGSNGPRMLRIAVPHVAGVEHAGSPTSATPRRASRRCATSSTRRAATSAAIRRTIERTVAVLVRFPDGTGSRPGQLRQARHRHRSRVRRSRWPSGLRAYAREGVGHVQLVIDPITRGSIEAFAPVLRSAGWLTSAGYESRVDASPHHSRESRGHGISPSADGAVRHRAPRLAAGLRGRVRQRGAEHLADRRPDAPRDAEPAPADPRDREQVFRGLGKAGPAHHGEHRDARRRRRRRRHQDLRDLSRLAARRHRVPLGDRPQRRPSPGRTARNPARGEPPIALAGGNILDHLGPCRSGTRRRS